MQQIDRNIELIRYRRYGDELLLLERARRALEEIRVSSLELEILPAVPCVEVAFNRGEADGEGAGHSDLGHAAFHGGDYPSSEIYRVTAHAAMFSSVHYCCNTL